MRNFFRCEWVRKYGKIPFIFANAILYSILMAVAKILADLTVYQSVSANVVTVYTGFAFIAGLFLGWINWNRGKDSTDIEAGK